MLDSLPLQDLWKRFFEFSEKMQKLSQTPEMRKRDAEAHITLAHTKIIGVVFRSTSKPVTPTEIAAELKLTPGAVTQAVDTLVRGGIFERCPMPGDRRSVGICPTEKGNEYKIHYEKILAKLMKNFFADIPSEDAETFRRVLDSIMNKLNEIYQKKDEAVK